MECSLRPLVLVAVGIAFCSSSASADPPQRSDIQVITAGRQRMKNPARDVVGGAPGRLMRDRPKASDPDAPGGGSGSGGGASGTWTDGDVQPAYPNPFGATLVNSVEGIGANGSLPPDNNMAVGDTQLVEIVNTEFAVYDKTGALLMGPAPIHSLFTALGGMCATADGGDPIVLFDQAAGRWFISQLEYNSSFTTNLLCTAVSTSDDATGTYVLYEWNFGSILPDYPKIGIWPDAYLFSANQFWHGSFFTGAYACAFDRTSMIDGVDAGGVCFTASSPSLMPASLDGSTPPSAGEPGFYLRLGSTTVTLYRFHVDFVTISNSTFTSVNLPVASVHQACGGGTCVPQPGTSQQLDSLGDRLMYRLSYRNFGGYESLLVNHSVQVRSSSTQTAPRWYEIRNPRTAPVVYQQSTFAPDSTLYRWMGSIAQDKQGNMLLGYSASNGTSTYPSIGYTGRLATDPVNQMQSESVLFFGTGSQITYSRWGDYSSMAIDPTDDCTFWFVGEYLVTNGPIVWHTRMESLKFPSCQ